MSTVPTAVVATIPSNNLFASIDIGTNSFKLLIIRAYPTGKFLTLTRQTLPSRHLLISSSSTKSLSLSLQSLIHFKSLISSHEIHPQRTFTVATHAVRQAENQKEFIKAVYESTGFDVNVLSGEEEAKFVYLGVLQFLPIWEKFVLCVDIGGGSTEFVIGREGKVVYCVSLKLGHVSLSERFGVGVGEMREFVRSVVERSGLVEEVKRFGFDVAVGSCGTIRAIEKAVFKGYCEGFVDDDNNVECRRDWRLSREDLKNVVERLCCGDEVERCRTEKYFKRRSDSIVAGAVLLEEIFGLIGIDEMEVSGYGLGEGVIAERLGEVLEGHDLSANARWRSVERLALRFNGKKRIKSAHQCASIARVVMNFSL